MEPTFAAAPLRSELIQRRERLAHAFSASGGADLARLLHEVDAALERFGTEDYGRCLLCGDPVEGDHLAADPLARYCLCELPAERLHRLDDDLRLAWQIQSGLLPRQDLATAGWATHFRYLPAGYVSGDYCDLIVCDTDGSLFFMLGDVAGKGVAASVLMAHLHALLRSLVAGGGELTDLLGQANRLFARSTGSNRYATLVVGRALPNGEVELCNAGHLPPLLRRGTEVVPLEAGGLPVGLFENSTYGMHRLRLDRGDTLVLYSDGLTEARNRDQCELGVEALAAVVGATAAGSPGEVAAACLQAGLAHRGGGEQEDDLTLLVISRA